MKKYVSILLALIFTTLVICFLVLHIDSIQRYTSTLQKDFTEDHIFSQDRKTHGFGTYNHDLSFNGDNRHYGVDYRLPENTDILAATDGIVTRTFKNEFGGNVLEIKEAHQPYYQWYMHLNTFKVQPGERVKAGDVIAKSGNTGSQTTGPHLHFQRMHGGIGNRYAEDPEPFIETLPEKQRSLYQLN